MKHRKIPNFYMIARRQLQVDVAGGDQSAVVTGNYDSDAEGNGSSTELLEHPGFHAD